MMFKKLTDGDKDGGAGNYSGLGGEKTNVSGMI